MRPPSYSRQRITARDRATAFVLLILLLLGMLIDSALSAPGDRLPSTRPAVSAVVRVGMTVDDMDRSIAFYTRVLDFTVETDTEVLGEDTERLSGIFGARCRVVRLRLGDEQIELTEYLTPRGRLVPRDSRSNDGWFQHIAIVTHDLDRAYARLREHRAGHASTAPQRLPDSIPGVAGIRAFYFRDPDDHVLEILSFPSDKGDPKWRSRDGLFLGIDHTAIVVANTERSLAFYRDRLGLRVAGGSENFGTEQAHLNNVRDAHLRITTLRAPVGPGIELLEYLTPRTGRPYPADAMPNDVFHWQTTVRRAEPNASLEGVTTIGATNGQALVRDPDGHALLLTSP